MDTILHEFVQNWVLLQKLRKIDGKVTVNQWIWAATLRMAWHSLIETLETDAICRWFPQGTDGFLLSFTWCRWKMDGNCWFSMICARSACMKWGSKKPKDRGSSVTGWFWIIMMTPGWSWMHIPLIKSHLWGSAGFTWPEPFAAGRWREQRSQWGLANIL